MKKYLILVLVIVGLQACKQKEPAGKFEVIGEIKNAPDQKVYLDQFYFSKKDPEVVDTAEMKNGKFELESIAPEQGMFRIRLEKQPQGYVFINDVPKLVFTANTDDNSLSGPNFASPANQSLKKFLMELNQTGTYLHKLDQEIDSLKTNSPNDSIVQQLTRQARVKQTEFEQFATHFADTTKSPVLALFTMGYLQGADKQKLANLISGLSKRFPDHQGIASMQLQFNQMLEEDKRKQELAARIPGIGAEAPDFTLPDPTGKPISLKSLRGKYVLVDFWASWCGPCRRENPNVVAAYKKYKNKNFTVFGVSLDEKKDAWEKAIMQDGLTWQHVSDLKGWNSLVVGLYGFDGIPYNILIDPKGKIIGTSLREADLDNKLAEVLK